MVTTQQADIECGYHHETPHGYLVITDDCRFKPCNKCGKLIAHGKESTFRIHECPKWFN